MTFETSSSRKKDIHGHTWMGNTRLSETAPHVGRTREGVPASTKYMVACGRAKFTGSVTTPLAGATGRSFSKNAIYRNTAVGKDGLPKPTSSVGRGRQKLKKPYPMGVG